MAQLEVKPRGGLGPGFWPVTVLLGVIWAIMSFVVIVTPATDVLREAAIPADRIDDLFKFLTVVGGLIFIYVAGYTVYFSIVFRRRPNAPIDELGIQVHGHTKLEFWWTVIPTILIVILAWFSVKIWADVTSAKGGVVTLEAIGYQFGFEFRYPGLAKPVEDELHVPLNVPITLHTTSRDVLHGFWVPEVRLKVDMVPGLINTINFTPIHPGQYRIVCSEYCGRRHGYMVSKFFVDTPDQFQAFIAKQKDLQAHEKLTPSGLPPGVNLSTGKADDGRATFAAKCSACHSLGGFDQKLVGPGLGQLFSDSAHPKLVNNADATPENVAGIIKEGFNGPLGVMPSAAANQITDQDIANLDVFLESLSKH